MGSPPRSITFSEAKKKKKGLTSSRKIVRHRKKQKTRPHLLEDKGSAAAGEPFGIQVVETAVNVVQIARPHVLTGIHSESSHSHVNQFVHEIRHLPSNVIFLKSQVQKANQTAVTHLNQVRSIHIRLSVQV